MVEKKNPISIEQLETIARLSRLYIEPGHYTDMARQIGDIINYVDILNSVDTSSVEPLYSPCTHETPVRSDQARTTLGKAELFANAPRTDGDFFIVPKIV